MFPIEWDERLPYWVKMNTNVNAEINKRVQPKDFVCLIGGSCQMPIVKEFNGRCIVMEFGVGYYGIVSPSECLSLIPICIMFTASKE